MSDDSATPRTLLRGFLREAEPSKSAKALRTRSKTADPKPRRSVTKRTPVNPPSAKDVANKMLSRVSTGGKRKSSSSSTPGEDATPRKLIAGLMNYLPPSTAVKPKRQRTEASSQPATKRRRSSRRLSSRRSSTSGDNSTPRTLLKHVLQHAPVSTPAVPRPPAEDDEESEEEEPEEELEEEPEEDIEEEEEGQEEEEEEVVDDTSLPPTQMDDTGIAEAMDTTETSEQPPQPTTAKAAPPSPPMPELDDDEDDTLEEAPPSPVEASIPEEPTPLPEITQDSQKKRQRAVTPQTLPSVEHGPSPALATPTFLQESQPKAKKALHLKPPPGPRTKSRTAKGSLPPTVVKNIFHHFSSRKTSKEALAVVQQGCERFLKQLSLDLAVYADHAGRVTIQPEDVELLLHRQGFITDKQPLNSLVEKYMGIEDRAKLIPVAKPSQD